MLLERSMNSLVSVTSANFGASRQSDANAVQVRNIKYSPAIQQGILRIECETFSRSTDVYTTIIQINNVEFVGEEQYNELRDSGGGKRGFEFTGSDGSNYYAAYDSGMSLDVKVGCTCEDFRWRFSYYNSIDGALLGEPPQPYVRKTNRPPVNQNKTPGVCKHLIRLKKELEREDGFFKELLN